MYELIYNYFNYLLYPQRNHSELAQKRDELDKMKKGRLFSLVGDDYKERLKLDFVGFTSVSWIFIILYSMYSLIFIHIGLSFTELLQENGYFPGLSISSSFQRKLSLFVILFDVVFFPLSAWVYVKFWRIIVTFFASVFDRKIEPEALDDVVNNALVGNFFLVIPVFGKFMKQLAGIFYIFTGLKYNLRFTMFQSLIIIFSPLLLVGVFILFIIMYILLLVNLY